MQLRGYQDDIVKAARGLLPCGCVVAPTGAGKTVIFSAIAKMATAKSTTNTVLILVNRQNLLQQAGKTLRAFGIAHSVVHGDQKRIRHNVVLSTVQTFSTLYKAGYKASIMIIDEAHNSTFDKFVKVQKALGVHVLGFTATPWRADKTKTMAKVYEHCAMPIATATLMEQGHLVRPRYFEAKLDLSGLALKGKEFSEESQEKVFADMDSLINAIQKHSLGKALVFVTGVDRAYQIAETLTEAGISSEATDGRDSDFERKRKVHALASGAIACLVNSDLLTFGFDLPSINTVIIYRATTSLALWHQMLGRAARPYENKTVFHVLDFGGNIRRLGLWEEDIDWQKHFNPPPKDPKDKEAPAVKECPACKAFMALAAKTCPECGWEKPEEEEKEGQQMVMVEYTTGRLSDWPIHTMPVPELIEMAKQRGYKKSWIHHQLASRSNRLEELTSYFTITGNGNPMKAAYSVLTHLGYAS